MTASIADLWALYFGGTTDAAYAALKAYADAGIDVLDVLAVASGTDTAEIVDGAVTTDKLHDSSVTSAKIVDSTIVAGDIADGAITFAKLAAAAGQAAVNLVPRSGGYTSQGGTSATTASPANSDGRFSPIWLPACTLDRIGLKVTSASNGSGDGSRSVSDGVTTNTSPTITSATAAFASTDIGRKVTGTGIPSGTYVQSVTNSTTAVLTENATATASSVSLTISGSVIRLGIYADNGSGSPQSLILDAGTIDATSATYQEITINQALTGGLYWLVAVTQGVKTTVPTVRAISGLALPGLVLENSGTQASDNLDNSIIGSSLATSTLPLNAGNPTAIGSSTPRVAVRFA